jgi:hypothetical protein
MYHANNSGRIDEKIEHVKFIEELAAKKKNLERKHATLLEEVRNFADDIERKVIQKTTGS